MSGLYLPIIVCLLCTITIVRGQTLGLLFEETFENCTITPGIGDKIVSCPGSIWISTGSDDASLVGGEVTVGGGTRLLAQVNLGADVAFNLSALEVEVATTSDFKVDDLCRFGLRKNGPGGLFEGVGVISRETTGAASFRKTFGFTNAEYFARLQPASSIQIDLVSSINAPDTGQRCIYDNIRLYGKTVSPTQAPNGAPSTREPTIEGATIAPTGALGSRAPATNAPTASPVVSAPAVEANDIAMIAGVLSVVGVLAAGAVFWTRRQSMNDAKKVEARGFRAGRVRLIPNAVSEIPKTISADDKRMAEGLLGPSPTFKGRLAKQEQAGRIVDFRKGSGQRRRKASELRGPTEAYLKETETNRTESMFRPSSEYLRQYSTTGTAEESISEKKSRENADDEDDLEV